MNQVAPAFIRFGLRILIAAVVLTPAAAGAQAPAAPAITGVVLDSTGAVLPNSQITLVAPDGTVAATTATDGGGAFTFSPGARGRYHVEAALDGFQTRTVDVTVGTGNPKPLRITLSLAALRQEITVTNRTAQIGTAAGGNADAVSVDQDALASLPVFDNDAVATVSRFLDSGSASGGVTVLVNGMEVNGLNVGTSAIQQIKINQDPYSAAYSRPGRGRIDILTKPGSDQFHGNASAVFRDARVNASNAFANVRPPEQRRIADGFVGGPVGHGGKTSFMLSVSTDSEDRQAIVFAVGPQGDIRGSVSQPFRHVLASVGLTQAGSSTISLRPSYEEETDQGRGAGGTTLGSAGTTYYHREVDLTYSQQTIIRPTLINQFQILVGHELEPMTSVSPAPGLVVNGAFTGGGAQVNVRRTELHVQLQENLAATRGRHLFQAGVQVPDWSRRGFDDRSDFGGTYYFSDLDAYAAGRPYSFVQQSGNGRIVWLEKVLGFYVNDDWQLTPGATLSYGLRYDWSNYFADHDTLAPRFSVAWKPGGAESTVLRGGGGLFYDKVGPFPVIDVREFQPGGLQRVVIANPAYPNPYGSSGIETLPPSIAEFAPGIQVPWTFQFSGGVEHQIKSATLSLMYYGSRGRLLRSRDVNAPLPPLYDARPDPSYGVIRQIDSAARQRGDSLQVTLRGRVARAFSGQMQYTLSRTLNESGGLNWFPANDYDASGEWARADFDRRHRLLVLGTLTPRRQLSVGLAITLQSGLPYSETLGTDPFNNGRGNARPAGVGRNTLEGLARPTSTCASRASSRLARRPPAGACQSHSTRSTCSTGPTTSDTSERSRRRSSRNRSARAPHANSSSRPASSSDRRDGNIRKQRMQCTFGHSSRSPRPSARRS